MSTHTKPFRLKPVAAALIALQGGFLPNAFAAPQDGTVVGGSASISQQGRQTTIEVKDLTEFIATGLKDPNLKRYVPERVLSGMCFPNNDPASKIDMKCN